MSLTRSIAAILLVSVSVCWLFAQEDGKKASIPKVIATVLGKPVYEADLNKHVSSKDNLLRLVINPLMVAYCERHEITRDQELRANIKDPAQRAAVRQFVLRAELNRHLYEQHGGRVLLDAFGPIAYDGMKKWITDQEKSGDLRISDPDLRAALDSLLSENDDLLFASPSQIKQAFDPAITSRFIKSMSNPDAITNKAIANQASPSASSEPIGIVMGQAVRLSPAQRNDPKLTEILYDLIVGPLEKGFLKKHPEIAPSEAELAELSKHVTSNGEEVAKSLDRSLQEIERKLSKATKGTDEYGELIHSKQVVVRKRKRLVDEGRRAKALLIARPAKLQQYLHDKYGGGRVIRRGALIYAFDAQKKWIDELERQGEFTITDPVLRAKFHEYWTNEAVHAANLHDERKAKAWFNPPWIEPSVAAAK